jgi:agmatinase
MGYRELFASQPSLFMGNQQTFEEATYVILGVPLDATSTYRSGSRFAPQAIREASLNIEGYSFRTKIDVEDLKIHDLGDLHIEGDVNVTLEHLALVAQELFEAQKVPVILGGEHTITHGVTRNLGKNAAIVSFDAHLDLHNEYLGVTTSHATFMRRIHERANHSKILEVGTRAVCLEGLQYAKKSGIDFVTARQLREDGTAKAVEVIDCILADYEKIYLTIDFDVLDPAFGPAVQNPEPEGLDTITLLNLLNEICDKRVIGFDLVEVTPLYDRGVTAIQAAKTVFEVLCFLEKARKA